MSEKHLSELGWTALAVKNKIKDKDLQKKLARFKTCKEDDFSQKLGCLEEIEEFATKLQKENKDNKEIVNYLKEVLMEVVKTSKAVELAKKKADMEAEQEEAAEEEEDSGLNLKAKLIAALKKAKMRRPNDPAVEALVGKAGSSFAVSFARKVGTAQKKELLELLKDRGQLRFIKGVCEYDAKVGYTIVLESPQTGATKALKIFLKEQTGLNYKILVIGPRRKEADNSDEEVPGSRPDPSPRFNSRFASLLPKIKQAIAFSGPAAQNLKLAASQAGMFARKKDFAQANRFLDTAEALLKKAQARP